MKNIVILLAFSALLFSCHENSSESNKEEEMLVTDTTSTGNTNGIENNFDQGTQDDSFLKNIPAFKNYIWDNNLKKATVPLQKKDTIVIHRGGGVKFDYYITLISHSDKHDNSDHKYWMKKIRKYSSYLPNFPNNEIDSLWNQSNYAVDQIPPSTIYMFAQSNYCNEFFSVAQKANATVEVSLGYSICN